MARAARRSETDFVSAFLQASPQRRFVMGTGAYARSVGRAVDIAAYVDDFTSDRSIDGVPIARTWQLPSDALVVVASMLRPVSALARAREYGLEALDYFAFSRISDLPVLPVTFWSQFRIDYEVHQEKYRNIHKRLADQESRDVFDDVVRFRNDSDLDVMAGYRYDPQGQYFEDFLRLKRHGETFVDVGSFDGQTSIEFASRCPEFSRIVAFEPSPANFRVVRDRLRALDPHRTSVLPQGLGDGPAQIRFDGASGSTSRASEDGEALVNVVTLDSLRLDSATFIKMDIEGAEIPALEGAADTISRLRPKLAIAAYHRFDDFWRIPEVIDGMGVAYTMYMRHYTEGIDETVMFFVPISA